MKKKIFFSIKFLILILVILTLYTNFIYFIGKFFLYTTFLIIVFINDILRTSYFLKKKIIYFSSISFSLLSITYISTFVNGDAIFLFYLYLYEFIIINKNKKYLLLHIFLYVFMSTKELMNYTDFNFITLWKNYGFSILTNYIIYFLIIFALITLKNQYHERKKAEKLNVELKKSLKTIADLSIEKERNRIAQEMHDSIGHKLSALIMRLDYIEKIIDIDAKKAKEHILKSQEISRSTMKSLREAVYALKENEQFYSLSDSINKLIKNIKIENIEIDFKYSKEINNIDLDIQNIIYKTVMESLTNSIKHGKPSKINLNILKNNNEITLNIKDNGIGCLNIQKSTGLNGIEERIKKVNGQVIFNSLNKEGFETKIVIPLMEGLK
ncbi:two-component sensor histidine kinase [Tepiditoga spiralis]|uniref:histidine kinase n=1 Tax=Tepiditoga spiralis TaxID=2108365 RepID=A0A7G1G4U7_9BACT|nr:sensor histidine kinase [Tepiditoga spiralis]BBE31568.1 two-component sensor histidine kinase [Tepiditoga spiralis]